MATDLVLTQRAIDGFLLTAVKDNDVAEVKKWLDQNASPNMAGVMDRTPLYFAASMASAEIVQLLLDKGALPNVCDDDGMTPLHIAIENKRFDIADQLIAHGANLNYQFDNKVTPLHTAFFVSLKNEDTACLDYVLKKGAKVDMPLGANGTLADMAADYTARFPYAQKLYNALHEHATGDKAAEAAAIVAFNEASAAAAEDTLARLQNAARAHHAKRKLTL